MLNKFKNLPVGLTGCGLGVATISTAWSNFGLNYQKVPLLLIAFIFMISIIIKDLRFPKVFLSEVKNPVIGSYVPTLAMCLMIWAGILHSFNISCINGFSVNLWLFAIALQIILGILFFYFQIKNYKHSSFVPSWYIPPIGIIVACVNGKLMGHDIIGTILLSICIPLYIVMMALLLDRLIFHVRLTKQNRATFGIMAAPASLCLAGYLTVIKHPNEIILHILVTLAILMTFLLYIAFTRLLREKFNPGFAAFTFPLAIGVVAQQKFYLFLISSGQEELAHYILLLAKVEFVIATLVILYVMIHFLILMYRVLLK
ncbi:MAG: TDT family transporter [Fusobacteria bacterium]|nr:TDT family transporter [Fusobacteriota bacterium]